MKELNKKLKTTANLPLARQTVINVFLTNTSVKNQLLEVLKPHDLSIEQFNVLRILRGQKGNPLNLQDIQERMVNKMSNTTRLIDKLILKDFVKRTECKVNRRKIEVYITNSGLKKLDHLDTIMNQAESNVTKNLSGTELEQLNELLQKLQQ
ncbi:MAG: MarR family transcriptional regulator [Psychroserpens sp.]|nr:MarR family transcriptional regulator [Psychroserpens sp.]MBO6631857.1 MarR family transcriptional regulator [Psychroserpens sp.]MBO6652549.1 MarR family transcriptional regulator [Psychroserpens sp.]MBO6681679.1 MarR family transcriptional regulator [Psychroserpens sp.]MBO6749454.1 MarR family transcriptional regulator [Psychroserpens sp.]